MTKVPGADKTITEIKRRARIAAREAKKPTAAAAIKVGMMKKIAQRLEALRDFHNESQERFAASIGVKQQSYAKWEAGLYFPSEVAMLNLCLFYKVDFNYIYWGTLMGVEGEDRRLALSRKLAQ